MTMLDEIQDEYDLLKPKKVVEYLNEISYETPPDYIPSEFALEFINFIKLVNGARGEENKSPVTHYRMLDTIAERENQNIINLCHRGLAKTTVMAEYLFLYIAVYGELPYFGKIPYALYVSDSVENGVKKMRLRLERRVENSAFLRQYLDVNATKFTDIRWYFKNKEGTEFVVTGHGAKTGVRGTVELNTRPHLAILDDLISDEDARSETVIKSVEDTVYKAIDYALHPTHNLIIWSGTPFNARDPLYKAVESGAWKVNVFPVCEQFPISRQEFKGSWEDRFTYDYVLKQYNRAVKLGKIDTFNQELMLRIMSEEDRLIADHEIQWYKRDIVLKNRQSFNFYITTDFATSDKRSADFSVISVWAYNAIGDWYWVDGICRRQLMDKNIDDLFKLVQQYRPASVGVEISGQQKGFIQWIQSEMGNRGTWFTLASDKAGGEPGIRPSTNKMERFNVILPLFKAHKIWFPEELRHSEALAEAHDELTLASPGGFKSKHDDFIDTISQLGSLSPWKPSEEMPEDYGRDYWSDRQKPNSHNSLDNYLV